MFHSFFINHNGSKNTEHQNSCWRRVDKTIEAAKSRDRVTAPKSGRTHVRDLSELLEERFLVRPPITKSRRSRIEQTVSVFCFLSQLTN